MSTSTEELTVTDEVIDRATADMLAEKYEYTAKHLARMKRTGFRVWKEAREEVRIILNSALAHGSLPVHNVTAVEQTAAEHPNSNIEEFRGEYRFLSNFWPLAGAGGDKSFTAEHWYQMQKTLVPAEQCAIVECATPGEVKRLSAELTVRPGWDEMKLDVMRTVVKRKFTAYPALGQQLLDTGSAMLIEGNHWCDTFWGCCTCEIHDNEGLNWLGILLMETRNELRA